MHQKRWFADSSTPRDRSGYLLVHSQKKLEKICFVLFLDEFLSANKDPKWVVIAQLPPKGYCKKGERF